MNLADLAQRGILARLDTNGEVVLNAPTGALTAQQLDDLRRSKSLLVAELSHRREHVNMVNVGYHLSPAERGQDTAELHRYSPPVLPTPRLRCDSIVHVDLETKSPISLTKCGVYRYAEEAEIIIAAWAIDDGPVQVWHRASGENVPQELLALIRDSAVKKAGFNANFERTLIKACWGIDCPPEQWRCTQVLSYANGLPGALADAAQALGLPERKDVAGKKLIKMFSVPQTPTARQPKLWLDHHDHPDEWAQFVEYCRQDVAVERAIHGQLRHLDLPAKEWELWCIDQRANDLGIRIDRRLVENAIAIAEENTSSLVLEAAQLTGLGNPNSPVQLKKWLLDEHGEDVASLNKDTVAELATKLKGSGKRMMEIRQQLAKTSVKKYQTMLDSVCRDGRVRGLLQFYGAARTGRWAGRLIQVQNLPRPSIEDFDALDAARELVLAGGTAAVQAQYDNVAQTLSDLLRTALVAASGHRLIVCDERAIEARVLAWLAGEEWRLEVFRTHGNIYEASAAQMFNVPLEKIKMGNPEYALRQKGKVAELALGYQGGTKALIKMGATKMGIPEEDLQGLVNDWRRANPRIIELWHQVEADAKMAVEYPGSFTRGNDFYTFVVEADTLFMILPGGRRLAYPNAALMGRQLSYTGVEPTTKKWVRIDTYGGKLVENLTQAIARDCMAEAMFRVRDAGYRICMTVHDEIVMEMSIGSGSLAEVEKLMGDDIDWAPGLPLAGAGFESTYYAKG